MPARWQHTHGAFYYRVPPGLEALWDGKQRFRLGKTLPEAYRVWIERMGDPDRPRTIGQLLDRYALEVLPTKAPKTQREQGYALKPLRKVFGALPLAAIKPRHVYEYVDRRSAKTAAHREIEILSHAYTCAVRWGLLDRHPFKGEVRLTGEAPRTRYVTPEELERIKVLARPALRAYIEVKVLTGLRRGDLLRLTASTLRDDGIHVTTRKTGKALIITWTDALRAAVNAAKAARPRLSPYLWCTHKGEPYAAEDGSANAWDSLWARFMDKCVAAGIERFHEHDLRAVAATAAGSMTHAQELLGHTDSRTTARVYRRGPTRVDPTQ